MLQLSIEYHFDFSLQLILDRARRPVSIDRFEPIEFLHGLELHLNPPLIFEEAVVHVRRTLHVVGNQRNAVYLPNPRRFDSANDRTRHQCVDIAIGQDDEARTKRRKDAVLELVCEIRRIEQAQGTSAENVPLHGLFEFAADKHRSFQPDVYCWKATAFEPVAKEIDLGRTAGSVGPFNNDELSLELVEIDARYSFSVKMFCFLHCYSRRRGMTGPCHR